MLRIAGAKADFINFQSLAGSQIVLQALELDFGYDKSRITGADGRIRATAATAFHAPIYAIEALTEEHSFIATIKEREASPVRTRVAASWREN